MESNNQPFKSVARGIFLFCLSLSFYLCVGTIVSGVSGDVAFIFGIVLSIMWTCAVIAFDLNHPHELYVIRSARTSLGFFFVLVGVVLGVFGPNYLYTSTNVTEFLIMFGLFFSSQVGLSLLLTSPLRSLSFSSGYLVSAIVLHSILLRFPTEFLNLTPPKIMVLTTLILSSWWLSQAIFFDFSNPLLVNESKNVKRVKSVVGILSALLTVIEFINILYTLFG